MAKQRKKTPPSARHRKPRRAKAPARGRTSKPLRLTAAQEQEYRRWSNATFASRRTKHLKLVAAKAAGPHYTVVAEGDSWFDYKPSFLEGTPLVDPGRDLLGHLQAMGRFTVYRVSEAGDTMENMVYGTATKGSGPNEKPDVPPEIDETMDAIREHAPDAFMLSAGGNDVAGVELESYLNHADSGGPPLREEILADALDRYVPTALAALVQRVRAINATLPIFLHGYDYPIPDGRPVVQLLGWSFVGPWLKPALMAKRYTDLQIGKGLLRTLLDRFNKSLQDFAAAHPHVHYIDLRGTLVGGPDYRRDWINELHPTSGGFKKIAQKMQDAMLGVLGG